MTQYEHVAYEPNNEAQEATETVEWRVKICDVTGVILQARNLTRCTGWYNVVVVSNEGTLDRCGYLYHYLGIKLDTSNRIRTGSEGRIKTPP